MIEENWDPVQQEHFITCCTVLQIQLSRAEGLNGPPRVALEILKDYKSTCPEPAVSPFARAWEEASRAFRETIAASSLQREGQKRGMAVTRKSPTMAGEKQGENWTQSSRLHGSRNGSPPPTEQGRQRCSPCQAASQARPLPQGAAQNPGICPCKAGGAARSRGDSSLLFSLFSRLRARVGTDHDGHNPRGLCCSPGLLACLAVKTLQQSLSPFSLNENSQPSINSLIFLQLSVIQVSLQLDPK